MNSWETVKFSPLFPRKYLCNQCQSCGLYIWVKTRALQVLQPSFPRSGTYSCLSAKHNLRKIKSFRHNLYILYVFLNICFYLFIWLHWVLVAAGGIQLPDKGWNLGPLHWERGVLDTEPPGKSLCIFFYFNYVSILFSLVLSFSNISLAGLI